MVRQHQNLPWEAVGEREYAGMSDDAEVWARKVRLDNPETGETPIVRRLELRLPTPTRDGDRVIHVLTDLPARVASASTVAGLYRKRWKIETLFQALKATPLGMNLQDLMPALKSGAVDAQDGVLPLVSAAQLYEQQSFCSATNHIWDGQWLCINAKAWMRLPDKLKDVVAAALDQAATRQRADSVAAEADVRKELTAKGMRFNTVDPASFRSALRSAGYYGKARQRVGEEIWDTLEKYTGPLA